MNSSSLHPSLLNHVLRPLAVAMLTLSLAACTLGPDYQRPDLPVASEFKPVSYTHLTLPTTPYV